MTKNLMLIVNPAAGSSGYKKNFGEALLAFDRGGYRVTTYFTSARGDAREFAASYASRYDIVVCVGGDGTLSEVMGGLMSINNPPPLGYIPMGTANDVATTLSLPKSDTLAAAERIMVGEPHPYDVGGFGDEGYFAYIAAFGAFTKASYSTPQNQKKVLGNLAYLLSAMSELPSLEAYDATVEYDGGIIRGRFLYGSVSNSTSVAGVVKLREEMVCLGDGISELVLVRDPGSVAGFTEIVDSVLSQRFDSENLLILHTRKAKFTFDRPVAWTRDGENGGEFSELELKNYECPIRLIF